MDFQHIRKKVFGELNKTNRCEIVDSNHIKKLGFNGFVAVWKVFSELYFSQEEASLAAFYICLPFEFPLEVPSVYLSREDCARTGHLPHVNAKGNVCAFDSDNVTLNPDEPLEIVRICLVESKRTIEKELRECKSSSFQEEFIAYWEGIYNKRDKVVKGLSMLSGDLLPVRAPTLAILHEPAGSFEIILHDDGEDATKFKHFLSERNRRFHEFKTFYIGDVAGITPPFYLTNLAAIQFIEQHAPAQTGAFEDYINSSKKPVVIFSTVVGGNRLFFGWIHRSVKQRDGFRQGKPKTSVAMRSFGSTQGVHRLKFESLTQKRLSLRTDGKIRLDTLSLALVGLGSIGSHLLHFLASLPVGEFRLVDTDVLKIENINRHLLGFEYVGVRKAHALQDFLIRQDPIRSVRISTDTVVKIVDKHPEYFNECDAVFIAIGKTSIEGYLVDSLRGGVLRKPLFILWVEPFMVAGHLIYVPAESTLDYKKLFKDGLYVGNAIEAVEYGKESNQMLMKEAGCQSAYIPYGQEYVTLFLSRLYIEIRQLIRQPQEKALSYTWVGNISEATERGLGLSTNVSGFGTNDVITTTLE
ncbi:ThiF family adenylyltransferase [Persicitalea sp.]|uniref:ThiF family adenylyltransferase n=1 Tax=Persicitalea sp. TaxID=3100273 RepID=UPI003593590E